eukprot:c25574_g1_i1 orf=499-1431(-)
MYGMDQLDDPFVGKELTGCVEIEHVAGKSIVTRLFAKYPLKFIVPKKVAAVVVDVVWVYTITYGGGFVSGDSIYFKVNIGAGCTAVLTTQASTKVYKSIQGLVSEQVVQVSVRSNALFALLPDPAACFSTAKYKQVQIFTLANDANIILVDWLTSGRRECGEAWDFDYYKSTNRIFLDDGMPLFLDSTCLEHGAGLSVARRMKEFHVVAMLVILGPQLESIRKQLEKNVHLLSQKIFRMHLCNKGIPSGSIQEDSSADSKLLASCSAFGPKGNGLVVRMVATSTELVYEFFREHLSPLASVIGVSPYTGK